LKNNLPNLRGEQKSWFGKSRSGVEVWLIQERRERAGVKSGRISNKDTLQRRIRAGDMRKLAKQGNCGTIVGRGGIV